LLQNLHVCAKFHYIKGKFNHTIFIEYSIPWNKCYVKK
jgi:hypothetical protein